MANSIRSMLAALTLATSFSVAACDFAQPYKMVDELMTAPNEYKGKEMKIHGWVEPGSIKKQVVDQESHTTFVLQREGKKVAVTNVGPLPDTFRDQSEVVASGVLKQEGDQYVFVAKELQAKCPSKYEGAQGNKTLSKGEPKFR
ncbi:MAG TPA: cytochrome c maturation protein CcmE [Kofleriaceae bacterium]|nr:cytochrome c maturation protein CcmE [Kofleriaceae bacterium]